MDDQAFSKTANCVFSLTYHMVLVTKRRRGVLTGEALRVANWLVRARCESRGGSLREFGGEPDHLHMLVSLPPTAALSDFANAVKTSTSRMLRRDFPEIRAAGPALWSPSYFVCTCGGASLERVKDYVRSQQGAD